MGTTLTSLLVRSVDQSMIRDAIEKSLCCNLHPWTPGDGANEGADNVRFMALLVDKEWSAVVGDDRDLDGLAAETSDKLSCPTLSTWIKNSDQWGYRYFESGAMVDAFDSRESAADVASTIKALDANEVLRRVEAGEDLADVGKDVRQKLGIPDVQVASAEQIEAELTDAMKELEDNLPDEIAELAKKVESGSATREENLRFNKWMDGRIDEMNRVLFKDPFTDFPSRASDEDIAVHVERLRPILPAIADEKLVKKTLTTRYPVADIGLSDFVRLLGVHGTLVTTTVEDVLNGDCETEGVKLFHVSEEKIA